MSRHCPAGLSPDFSLSDKQALLAGLASSELSVDNPLYEFAAHAGVDAIQMLLDSASGIKIHIPNPDSFWVSLYRKKNRALLIKQVDDLIQTGVKTYPAVEQVCAQHKISHKWLYRVYKGLNDHE